MALCRFESGRLAIYKRDSDAGAATNAIAAALSTVVATGGVRATGWVSIAGDGLPTLSNDVVLRLAGFALNESRSTAAGRAERLVLGRGPTRDDAAAASQPVGRE